MFDEKHPKASPKDFFLNLLAIITLYLSAASLLTLLFQIINISVPDLLEQGGFKDNSGRLTAMRFAISSLIVTFPLYVGTMMYLQNSYLKTPFKRNLWIRKWLIYFTLFAATLIIMGDIIALVNNLLGGELKVRFFLKFLSLLFVAGSIFAYYVLDIRKYKTE